MGATGVRDIAQVLPIYYQSCVLACKQNLTWNILLTGEKVEAFPVIEIDQKDIVDTNGAGDAFVGGMVPKVSKSTEQRWNNWISLLTLMLVSKLGYNLTQ